MFNRVNLSITIPSSKNLDRYISFRLKQNLYNEPSEFKAPQKILAVSDIQGDFLAFRRLLLKNKVINSKYDWTFGEGHLVILGDCFNRGEQITECLWLIYSLEERANREGGYVHFILGNHEVSNLNGDWRYVHPKYAEHTKSQKPHTALYDGSAELWRWLCTKNIVEKIGSFLFVHGGISEKLLHLNIPLAFINNRVRPYYTSANELFADPLLNTVFNSEDSPFWYQGYYQPGVSEELINIITSKFSVKTVVTGHTKMETITPLFYGKVININARHATGKWEGLLIKKDKLYRVNSNGDRDKLMLEV